MCKRGVVNFGFESGWKIKKNVEKMQNQTNPD